MSAHSHTCFAARSLQSSSSMRFWDLPNKMLELLKLDSSVKERRGTRSFSITAKTFPKLYENEKLGSVILLMTLSHGRIPTMIKVGINVA